MSERLFVACTSGLEAALVEELASLGLAATTSPGGCDVSAAPERSFVTVNVRSRLASKVWWHVGSATTPRDLARLPLRQRLGAGPLRLTVKTSGAPSPPAEVWRNELTRAHRLGVADDAVELMLRLDGRSGELFVDTSGELLYRRGARQETGKAPLRETLAAGVLRLAGWRPGEPLWDVMCGSGTIMLEAAEQALGLWPGRSRGFSFEAFPGVGDALVAARAPTPAIATWLRGTDLNAGALGVARRNARRAGVGEAFVLERVDATKLVRPATAPGLVVANLPYGKRVGQRFELDGLYRAVGHALKKELRGWRFAFLLADGNASLGLEVRERFSLSNGGLSCSLVCGVLPPG